MARDRDSHPRCQAELKDGSPCHTHAAPGNNLCAFHERRRKAVPAREVREELEGAGLTLRAGSKDSGQSRRVPVADVRSQLARDAAEEYEVLRGALLDALKAHREAYVTCPECGKRHPVVVPDWTARVKAVDTLLDQGFGQRSAPSRGCDCAEQVERRAAFLRELSEEENVVCTLASSLHGIEAQLSRKAERDGLLQKSQRAAGAGAEGTAGKRLRLLLIELFELGPGQVRLLQSLAAAWGRIGCDTEQIRALLRGPEHGR